MACMPSGIESGWTFVLTSRLTSPPLAELTQKLDTRFRQRRAVLRVAVGLGSMNGRGIGVLDDRQLVAVHHDFEARLEGYPRAGIRGPSPLGDALAVEHDIELIMPSLALARRHGLNPGDGLLRH